MTQVVLHIGMHKAGSTAIQKRLEANAELLDRLGISFDDDSKNQLKSAAKKRDFKPWRQKLRQARKRNNSTLLISNEVLSHLLAPEPNQPGDCHGTWLTEAFLNKGCSVTLVAFIRDQPNYLNSQYTQHVKKFGLDCSFETFARRKMDHTKARGECDPWRLFGWILEDPRLTAHLLPYGGTKAADPFQQLLHVIGTASTTSWRDIQRVNEQPGRLAIATALEVLHQRALQERPLTGRRERKRAFRKLEAAAKRHGWPKERYNGLTPALYREIRAHYRSGNDAFAQRVWGEANWATLFPDEPPTEQAELRWHQRWLVEWEIWPICRALQR